MVPKRGRGREGEGEGEGARGGWDAMPEAVPTDSADQPPCQTRPGRRDADVLTHSLS